MSFRSFFGPETGFLIIILNLPKEYLKERISIRQNYNEEMINWLMAVREAFKKAKNKKKVNPHFIKSVDF